MEYVSEIPRAIPAGKILVHNQVRPQSPLGRNGFRAWLTTSRSNIQPSRPGGTDAGRCEGRLYHRANLFGCGACFRSGGSSPRNHHPRTRKKKDVEISSFASPASAFVSVLSRSTRCCCRNFFGFVLPSAEPRPPRRRTPSNARSAALENWKPGPDEFAATARSNAPASWFTSASP